MKKVICFFLIFIILCINIGASSVTWFSNLDQYVTGNLNRLYNFKNGYAVFVTGRMGEDWSTSNEQTGIIDKFGNIVYGPIDGDVSINILENDMFCIGSSSRTSIFTISGIKVADYNGVLLDGGIFNENQIAPFARAGEDGYARLGLVGISGEVVVACKYLQCYYEEPGDTGFVFIKSKDAKSADVYNADGSFSHSVSMKYQIADYANNLLEIADESGYRGIADIYGNILIEPENYSVEIYQNRIFLSGATSSLLDHNGNVIKTYESHSSATEMYEGRFLVSQGSASYLVTENGEILNIYEETRYPNYVGDGVFSVKNTRGGKIRFVDADTGEYIGGEYKDKSVEFNEGYAVVEDLDGNSFVIDKDGNKYCEEYSPTGTVSDGVLIVYNEYDENSTPGIVRLPKYKRTKLIINAKTINLKDKPQNVNDRTFYPFRECLENLGATVSWNEECKIAVGEHNGVTVEFPVGKSEYWVNGVKYDMDASAYIDNKIGRTYIPIRYAAEAFGFTVDWIPGETENIISIYK